MAGTLTVQNIEGPSSGANANKVIIPGHVIQVVHARTNTEVSGDTTTYTDTTLSASITPTSTSSKILIRVNQHIRWDRYGLSIRVVRDSTAIQEPANKFKLYSADTNDDLRAFYMIDIMDEPSSTSAITYKTQYASNVSSGANIILQGNSFYSYITLMEVAQ